MPNSVELVGEECGLGRRRPGVRWTRLTGRHAGACKDWSHPSRGVHLNRAGLGRGEWRWHPFERDGRLRPRRGKFVGVGASRKAAPRSVRRRSRRPDAAGSENRGWAGAVGGGGGVPRGVWLVLPGSWGASKRSGGAVIPSTARDWKPTPAAELIPSRRRRTTARESSAGNRSTGPVWGPGNCRRKV